MRTEEKEYAEYLRGKFLPGRRQYLEHLVYPRYLREFGSVTEVWDLGFGNGEFLEFCGKRRIASFGIDSNPDFVSHARSRGLQVFLDSITRMDTIPEAGVQAALSDNVLEHLDMDALMAFFKILPQKIAADGLFLAVVPGERGFKRDPTHRTFIDESVMCSLIKPGPLELRRSFRYPVNAGWVSRAFYLNMTIFCIGKSAEQGTRR